MTTDGKGLLSTKEAAEYLSVSPETMERWRRRDPTSTRFPKFLRLGDEQNSRVRYAIVDLDRWLDKRRRASRAIAMEARA